MNKRLLTAKKYFLIIILLFTNFIVSGQSEPFNCDYNAYLFQNNDVYGVDLASGNYYLVASNITEQNINGAGYNPADGYIWGFVNASGSKQIVKIAKNFEVEYFEIKNLPASGKYVGDISADGYYYLKGNGSVYYKIDLNSSIPEYMNSGVLSKNIHIHDWAFNAVDGQLYTVEKSTNHLYRIDLTTNEVIDLGEVPILSGLNYTYGAVYFDASGRFYVSANQTGTIYMIQNVQDLQEGDSISSNLFAFGPSSSSNDGARCPTAPVPQEDCINGIDDDGDGLVDCDDPACSGVAACPVIEPPVSGGNNGGLESNNRLSQQISKRNYLRNKTNYKFDKKEARRIKKTASYKKDQSKSSFDLMDLIPLDVLEGTTAIESSSSDLIEITNATELFSVDYLKEDKTVAVILAAKTENGVYEHTKYICDRLLGAELLSVATIEIKEQSFIRSIIKNIDDSKEFVLSFSGKLINNDANFEIESHWNIDKYENEATFYNFQIWANKIDDLLILAEEALELFEVQRPITSFNNSNPPAVFVKKGKYKNGALELELVNTNQTENITLDAGFRRTETSNTEYTSANIELQNAYISSMIIDTGSLFDIGFRIRNDANEIPDDLFMSDGVWGLDDSAEETTIHSYAIEENNTFYTGEGLNVERNINLRATTKNYVAVYRSFTPRFQAVNLSEFDNLEFDASGTGDIEITMIKKSVENWEHQFKTTITLSATENHYVIPYSYFTSANGEEMDLMDAVSIVFTMSSDGVETVQKELNLKNLEFTQRTLSAGINELVEKNNVLMSPNPIISTSEIRFYSEVEAPSEVLIYNVTGTLVKEIKMNTTLGNNMVQLSKEGLKSGLYFMKIKNDFRNYNTIKFIVN